MAKRKIEKKYVCLTERVQMDNPFVPGSNIIF